MRIRLHQEIPPRVVAALGYSVFPFVAGIASGGRGQGFLR
jgi:hypothetical protein